MPVEILTASQRAEWERFPEEIDEASLSAFFSFADDELELIVGHRAEFAKADTKRVLDALEAVVFDELGNAQKVRIGGLVQVTVRVKPAQKKRQGRNPATGEEGLA